MVIGIRGESGAGKSTLALMLSYVLNQPHNPNLFEFLQYKKEADQGFIKGKWKVANFASTLKSSVATLYGIDFKQYEDGVFKDQSTGIEIFYVRAGLTSDNADGFILRSFSTHDEAEEYMKFLKEENPEVYFFISRKVLTWRDTLNLASDGLHLLLGQDITLQAYQHRFDNAVEHLIMADVRKPREIDLIKANGGVVIWLKRNFVFEATSKEVAKFYSDKGYFYSLADGQNPEQIFDREKLDELIEFEVPLGIDCKPKFNIADTWLAGDDRHDFVFHNPLNNPKHQEAYSAMLNDIIAAADIITDQLLKNDKA